ncbi:MAG: serine/threonine-protein kinase [Elusimicrobiota bacterium]
MKFPPYGGPAGLAALIFVLIFFAPAAAAKKRSRRAAAAPPQQQQQQLSDDRAISDLKGRIEAQMKTVKPRIAALKAFTQKYPDTEDLETIAAERQQVRSSVLDSQEDLKALLEEFKTLRKEFQYKRGVMILAQFMTGDEPNKVDQDLKAVLDLGDYPDRVKRVIHDATNALDIDQTSYQKIVDQHQAVRRRRQLYILGGLGAGIFAAFIIFLARARKARRMRTVTGVPVAAAQGALPQFPAQATPPGRPITVAGGTPMPALLGQSTPMPAPLIPDMIGGSYKVVREKEKGALGPVYEAHDRTSGKKVLIKRIREELHRTEKDMERFLARARFVASMKHPNLAEVYSVFLEEERIHLVIEDPEGSPLSKFLDTGNRIALASAKRLMKQVCGLIDFAHSKKILHGDLMPSNIFINKQGAAKVMDFGIGLEARKTAAKLNWTESIGSPAYMAPEQELGSAFPASDIYSLAIILYEMITGRLPFEGPNFLAQKREKRYRPVSRFAADIPQGLDLVFDKALQPEPQLRFAKAMDFYAAIEPLAVPPNAGPPASSPGHGA